MKYTIKSIHMSVLKLHMYSKSDYMFIYIILSDGLLPKLYF